MIITPKTRGFICTTAHPAGCSAHIQEQIDYVKKNYQASGKQYRNVLVLGASTGYGIASRIVTAFGMHAKTLGVFFEKAGTERKTASAGWYNTAAFEQAAQEQGLYAKSLNGDAFSHDMKQQVCETIARDMGKVDLVVYSLASPKRVDPDTGEVYKSVLKTVGDTFHSKNLNTDTGKIEDIAIPVATAAEIEHTVQVMGGADWQMWIDILAEKDLLADGVDTVAYSYIGPSLTWEIYKQGSIGEAKKHLQQTADNLQQQLAEKYHGNAYISVNKALVTQASSAIPVVPLYISILYKEMKEQGIHEECIEQMTRLFQDFLGQAKVPTDDERRIRIDDWEMREDIQEKVQAVWQKITTENLAEYADYQGYKEAFLKLFGFGLSQVDYTKESDPLWSPKSLT